MQGGVSISFSYNYLVSVCGCAEKITHRLQFQIILEFHRSNPEYFGILKKPTNICLYKEIGRRKWRWIGHTLRKPTSSITRHALQWNPQGKRGRRRPQTTWWRQVEEDMKRGDISWREAARNAQDRDKWKSVVCGLYPEIGISGSLLFVAYTLR
ncbi:hypothetical protein RRG08_056346 [Elysia crispata]|uniref:Uncharacterized protein n=1 Tax=Elysia crispata TaxID=231223 RepID=A0AAE1D2C5_9GAST|nr:hypothetical protein RRG08_056346 [Elysia crispata]